MANKSLDLSLSTLGSEAFQQQILDDIDELKQMAEEKNLIPRMLVVGKMFMEFGSVQSVIDEQHYESWEEELEYNFEVVLEQFKTKLLSIYENCYNSYGKFASESKERGFSIYFDPSEFYICLKCIDPFSEANEGDLSTKDGYSIVELHFEEDQILIPFLSLKN